MTDSCVSFLRLGCLPWTIREKPIAVPLFRDMCMPQDGNLQFAYRNKTVGLLRMAHTPAACEDTCRTFVCGSAHIPSSEIARCCFWAQALFVAAVREHEAPLDLGEGVCDPRSQEIQLIDCDWMHKIADEICPSATRSACAVTQGLNIKALELEDSTLARVLSMSTLVALALAFLISQVCILCVRRASVRKEHKADLDGAVYVHAPILLPMGSCNECDGAMHVHARLLPPGGACSCE